MPITLEQIQSLVDQAIWSPSGDNCQPWTFGWQGQTLSICHDAARGAHPLNLNNVASILALGTLVESLAIAASAVKYKVNVAYDFSAPEIWARITFLVDESLPEDPLLPMLGRRCTDRRMYKGGELTSGQFGPSRGGLGHLGWQSGPHVPLTDFIVQTERAMIEIPTVLPAVLKWIRFTKASAVATRDGLPWQNLGVRPWEVPSLALFKSFPKLLPLFKPVLLPSHLQRVRKLVESSAGTVCVSAPLGKKDYIADAGRLMLRTWCQLNQQGFGVQPLTLSSNGIYWYRMGLVMDLRWQTIYAQGETLLREVFSIPENYYPIWMIRAGRIDPLPQARRTYRRQLVVKGLS